MVSSHVNQVRIVNDVTRKNDTASNGVDEVHRTAEGEDQLHESGHTWDDNISTGRRKEGRI
jgi:hypothetical protein